MSKTINATGYSNGIVLLTGDNADTTVDTTGTVASSGPDETPIALFTAVIVIDPTTTAVDTTGSATLFGAPGGTIDHFGSTSATLASFDSGGTS